MSFKYDKRNRHPVSIHPELFFYSEKCLFLCSHLFIDFFFRLIDKWTFSLLFHFLFLEEFVNVRETLVKLFDTIRENNLNFQGFKDFLDLFLGALLMDVN